jgi:hypothetical protein
LVTKRRTKYWAVAFLALALGGCSSKTGEPELASDLAMNSARTAKQLLTGFYGVESGAWRWTARSFSVALGVPAGAAAKGGKLTFRFVFPDPAFQLLHSVTLSAKIKDTALAPESYSTTGEHVYTKDIAAADLASSPVRVDFTLDKAMPPGPVDVRELGVIAYQITLVSK